MFEPACPSASRSTFTGTPAMKMCENQREALCAARNRAGPSLLGCGYIPWNCGWYVHSSWIVYLKYLYIYRNTPPALQVGSINHVMAVCWYLDVMSLSDIQPNKVFTHQNLGISSSIIPVIYIVLQYRGIPDSKSLLGMVYEIGSTTRSWYFTSTNQRPFTFYSPLAIIHDSDDGDGHGVWD